MDDMPNQKAKMLMVDQLVCRQCLYRWAPRDRTKLPKNCPSCRTIKWMRGTMFMTCKRCGHDWISTDKHQSRCPSCGTYKWNDSPTVYKCFKCSHKWNGKRDWPPHRCPVCRSTKWKGDQAIPDDKEIKAIKKLRRIKTSEEREDFVLRCYDDGASCTNISLTSGIPFNVVMDIVAKNREHDPPRV